MQQKLWRNTEYSEIILLGVSPMGSGFTGLRYRYGASTSLTAAPTIPNALATPIMTTINAIYANCRCKRISCNGNWCVGHIQAILSPISNYANVCLLVGVANKHPQASEQQLF